MDASEGLSLRFALIRLALQRDAQAHQIRQGSARAKRMSVLEQLQKVVSRAVPARDLMCIDDDVRHSQIEAAGDLPCSGIGDWQVSTGIDVTWIGRHPRAEESGTGRRGQG